jgi:hypothetical protein
MPPPPCLRLGYAASFPFGSFFFSSCLFSFVAEYFSFLSRYMRPVLSLANARARRYALLPLPRARRAPVRFLLFLSFSFHSLTAAPSCLSVTRCPLAMRRAFASRCPFATRCAFVTRRPCRRAFVTRRPCRVVLSSSNAPVASRRAFATRCAFVTPRLATSRRSCGGNGGEHEWAGGQGGM